ncbi:MAG TPA: transcriptional regulator [Elusimicrobia bacterium]|nr:transcriptional regulator [Elusimicrobiota bacterium]
MERRLFSIDEVAEYLGVKKWTLYAWVSQRRIPFVKCGRLTKFDLRRIEQWIQENTIEEQKFDLGRKF